MKEYLAERLIDVTERGWTPDALVRMGIRRLCASRLSDERRRRGGPLGRDHDLSTQLSDGPIALSTAAANAQHYELPPSLFVHTLGPRLKYSCCYWPEDVHSLAEAEERALAETCARARIEDGMDVLELGCGWGSLTLWIAEHYPNARVTAVSNSASQREFIESRARELQLRNIRVITANMNEFDIAEKFDRIVSVEMFEHMHNFRELFRRVAGWMRPDAKLFVHVFAHREFAYKYEPDGASNWMAQHFFTGGMMPSMDFLPKFQDDVFLVQKWWWDGRHYARTAEAWLENMASHRETLMEILASTYGPSNAHRWYQRWRMFYMACAELWGYRDGKEWGVAHYLFEPAIGRTPTKSLAVGMSV